jgi:hypothetical protein
MVENFVLLLTDAVKVILAASRVVSADGDMLCLDEMKYI